MGGRVIPLEKGSILAVSGTGSDRLLQSLVCMFRGHRECRVPYMPDAKGGARSSASPEEARKDVPDGSLGAASALDSTIRQDDRIGIGGVGSVVATGIALGQCTHEGCS